MAQTARMTEEQKARLLEAKRQHDEQKQATRQKRLVIGHWSIYRFDEWNIALHKDGQDEPLYYPDTQSALKGLFRRITDPSAKSDVASILKQIADAERRILAAVANSPALAL